MGLLPDEGLETLAAIFNAIEGLGLYPSQQMFLVIQMLGKPKGGYRPIVMFSAIARLWERARRREARAWLASMARFDEPQHSMECIGALARRSRRAALGSSID